MYESIVSSVSKVLTPDIVARMASASGISESADAKKTIAGAVPAILSGLAGMAAKPEGARQLADTIAQQPSSMLEDLAGMIGGTGQLAGIGKTALTTLFGGSTAGTLASALARFSGVGDGAARSLLSMLTPVVLGVLGRQGGTGASGLAQFLEAQKDSIAGAMPPQLSDLVKASGVFDPGATPSSTARRPSPITHSSPGIASIANAQSPSRASSSPSRWMLWAIPALALLGLGWYLVSGDRAGQPGAAGPPQAFRPTGQGPITASELQPQIAAAIGSLDSTLQSVKDAASAAQALPKLQQAAGELDRLTGLTNRLPIEARDRLAEAIKGANTKLKGTLDNVMAMPGLAADMPPLLSALRKRADALGMTPAALAQQRGGGAVEGAYLRRSPSGAVLLSTYSGRSVLNRAGERIGSVNDLILAPEAGTIAALVGVGGFLGMGEKEIAVPFSLIEVVRRDNDWHLVMDASKEALREAPAYEDTAARARPGAGSGTTR